MKTIKRLIILFRPYTPVFIGTALMLVALTAIDMVFPEIISQVVNVGFVEGHPQYMVIAAGILVGLGLGKWFLNFGYRYYTQWLANKAAFDLRNQLYDHIQRLPFTYHDYTATGQLISRVIEDVRSLANFTGSGMFELTRTIILMVGIIVSWSSPSRCSPSSR